MVRAWAVPKRKQLDRVLGVSDREQDPDLVAMKGMSEKEEWEYLYKTYLAEEVEKAKGDEDESESVVEDHGSDSVPPSPADHDEKPQ